MVYRGRGPDGMEVALKTLHDRCENPEEVTDELDREARIASRLDHPFIVRTFELFYINDRPWIVMEYFPGRNIKQLLMAKSPVIRERAKDIMTACADALGYLHSRGLIHLDMKPENVLVADSGETKLIDFALATDRIPLIQRIFPGLRKIAGTRGYIAPETILKKSIDPRTDIYSYGTTFYEMLCGRPVFPTDDQGKLLQMHLTMRPSSMRIYCKDLTEDIDKLILQMLEKDPARRPPDMASIIGRLERMEIFKKGT